MYSGHACWHAWVLDGVGRFRNAFNSIFVLQGHQYVAPKACFPGVHGISTDCFRFNAVYVTHALFWGSYSCCEKKNSRCMVWRLVWGALRCDVVFEKKAGHSSTRGQNKSPLAVTNQHDGLQQETISCL